MTRIDDLTNLHKVLVKARELITDPAHHCVGAFAQDANGRACWTKHAVKRDIHAALSHASATVNDGGHYIAATEYLNDRIGGSGYSNLSDINDQGHAAALALLDGAISDLARKIHHG